LVAGEGFDNRVSRYSYCLFPIAYCLSLNPPNQNLYATEQLPLLAKIVFPAFSRKPLHR
jgi:hypothetical protein